MHRNVEVLIGRLATDPGLQTRFAQQPTAVLREQGLELNEVEMTALAATDPEVFRAFTAALDTRLRKAAPANGSHGTNGETPVESQSGSEKEIPQ